MGNHWNRIMSQGLVTADIAKLKRIVGHMDTVDEMTLRDFKILLDFQKTDSIQGTLNISGSNLKSILDRYTTDLNGKSAANLRRKRTNYA